MTDKLIDISIIVFFLVCLGLVIYLALKLQKLNALNQISLIELKDDDIEKTVAAESIEQLVSDNNTPPKSS